jgi:hypothetical protein
VRAFLLASRSRLVHPLQVSLDILPTQRKKPRSRTALHDHHLRQVVQKNVGGREPVSAQPSPSLQLVIQPIQRLVDHDLFVGLRGRRGRTIALVEVCLRRVVAVLRDNRLRNLQIHAPQPHARLGPLFCSLAVQARPSRGHFVELLADCRDFGQEGAVRQSQGR